MTDIAKGSDREKTVIFLHMPKAAGSTLERIILRQYEPTSVFSTNDNNRSIIQANAEFKRLPESRKREIKILLGHNQFGLHKHLPQPCTYITILRDPVERIISHYYFVLRSPFHYLYNEVTSKHMSLKDYVCSGISTELNNGQTRLLSTTGAVTGYGQCSIEMLESAKNNLKEHFAVVGLTERFDETLLVLKRTFNWNTPFYIKQNVATNKPLKQNISKDTLNAIEKYNDLDIKLFIYVKEKFEQVLNQSAYFSEIELKQFKLLNGIYSRVYPFSRRVINAAKSM